MRIVLDHRDDEDQGPMAEALLACLEEPEQAAWVESERSELVRVLRSGLEAAGESAGPPTTLAELPAEAQHHFAQASAIGYAGEHDAARRQLEPLLAEFPEVYELRELACHLDEQTGVQDSPHCAAVQQHERAEAATD